ncbi:MAG: DPP IV N-terminal domain-containing protein [Candidatus Marinimicrobia bacterium]|nr:DPP IV N-terminal domain-containing protein [Candidatus Neomarinimicrobiota bacterium]
MNFSYFKLLSLPLWFGALSGQQLTLEDIFLHDTYAVKSFRLGPWVEGGAAFLVTEGTDSGTVILRQDLITGKETLFMGSTALQVKDRDAPISLDAYTLSPDEHWVLMASGKRSIWRRSSETTYYLHDRRTGITRRLAAGNRPQSNAQFSPDSRQVAYVMGHNLYVHDLEKGRTRQLTKDGSETIINGQADWLYEEEFSLTRAYEWSPDSKTIALLRFDQERVRAYTLVDEMGQYTAMTTVRYPKVGERNSVVTLGLVDVKKGKTRWVDLGPEPDIYIPRLTWTGRPGEVAFYRLDRRQQRLELVFADARTRKTRVVATQTDSAWVDVTDDLHFIDEGNRFIWTTEASGYRHITMNDREGRLVQQVTEGQWEVTRIIAVDEVGQLITFTGKKDGATEQQVYSIGFDGSHLTRLTDPGGWNTIQFTPDFSHYIHRRSDRNTPPMVSLHLKSGERVRWFVEAPAPALAELDLPQWDFFTLTTTDGTRLNAVILKPPGFDPNRKYPTVIYTYGGPGSQVVTDRWGPSRGRGMWHLYLAQEGYVVLVIDNRGTGGRGKAFKNLVYGDLGKWSLHDQLEGAAWIARQPWGDGDRIGIWGWSGGGYLTALALTAGSGSFKIGIAVAPVTDFRLYDTAWTERYMGLLPENAAGYDSADVLSYVHRYQGGLLLIHGTGDDNVHAQHSWQLIRALVNRDAPFDMMMYPGKNHGLPGVTYHLYSKLTAFIREHL